MEAKPFWLSKMFWVNVLAIVAMVVQFFTGFVIDPATQVIILGTINTLLRFITKAPIDWGNQTGAVSCSFSFMLAVTFFFVTVMAMAGCATVETPQSLAAKSLLSTRQGVIAAATTVDGLCTQGVMKQADCDKAALLYTQAQAAYTSTSDAFLLYLQLADQASLDRFQKAQLTFQALFLDLDGLAKAFQGGAH